MDLYFNLLKKPVFKVDDVNLYYDNINSARSAIKRLIKENMVVKIRNNLYTCISGETGEPVANKFQIASSISDTSYVSHHTALEYYGIFNQIYYEVYVSSQTKFHDFDFDGFTYRYVSSNSDTFIDTPLYSGGIAVTTLERTIVDSIKDMDKISGLEEVVKSIYAVNYLEEKNILDYLEILNNQFLYQKVGYLFLKHKNKLGLSNEFFDTCHNKIGKSKRYLSRDVVNGVYDSWWRLIVPQENIVNKGVIENATI